MLYSCFDSKSGLYDYYADKLEIPLNADLPVPSMPSPAGKVGVPAIDAGRPLPGDAKHIGRGWHAKGMIVQCGRGSLGAVGSGGIASALRGLGVAAGVGVAGYYLGKRSEVGALLGLIVGGYVAYKLET